ncbi:3112_t:CDS:2 [Entrophospora sp. SA101]|nr:3112_t:CDS:2 [Entrophospora sp. SA101]
MTITAVTDDKDTYNDERKQEHGICTKCARYNTSKARCKSCDPNPEDVNEEPLEDPDNQFEIELPHEREEDEEPPGE